MDRTAGYAASIAIRQQLIQKFVRVLYNAGRISPFLSVSQPTISTSFFLSLPQASYRPGTDGRLALDLFAWGPMTITPPGGLSEARRVKFRVRVLVPQTIVVSNGKLVFGVVSGGVSITNVEIDPYAGGLWSPATLTYIASPEFQTLLTLGIQAKLSTLGDLLPPLDISLLGAIAAHPNTTVTHTAVDEALVLGLDIDMDVAGERVVTHGTGGLSDTSAGNDIGIWISPAVVEVAYSDVRAEIQKEVDKAQATLDEYHLRVREDHFLVTGSASRSGGAVNFSVHAVPQLIRPGVHFEWDEEYGEHFEYSTPDREELWFDPQEVVVDIVRDWWVVLLDELGVLFTAGIGALVVESFVTMIRGNITSGIEQNTPTRAARNQEFTIAGVARPAMQLRLETFECHAEGVFAGIKITPQFWAAALEGPERISAEEALTEIVQFAVDLPPDTLAVDPELRARWTVRRTDTNEILISRDTFALGGLTLSFDNSVVPFLEISELSIESRVYRTLGAGTVDLFFKLQFLRISDYVDRSHPFVQWDHQASVPLVRVETDGTRTLMGYQTLLRHSNIHRTALPGRCRMLRHYSLNKLFPSDGHFYPLVYLDALPFPESELVQNRAQVCDYCFFGGPDKDVPLI